MLVTKTDSFSYKDAYASESEYAHKNFHRHRELFKTGGGSYCRIHLYGKNITFLYSDSENWGALAPLSPLLPMTMKTFITKIS